MWFSRAALALAICLPSYAAISIVSNTCEALGVTGTGTTATHNITGATNVSIGISYYVGGTFTSVTDNNAGSPLGDSLNARAAQTSTEPVIRTYDFDFGSAVSYSTYSVTVTGLSIYSGVCIKAWSGGKASGSFDNQAGTFTNGGTNITLGTLTPANANEISAAFIALGPGSSAESIGAGQAGDSAYSSPVCVQYSAGVNEGICSSHWIQTTATATGPKWSWTGTTQGAGTYNLYQAAPSGGTVTPKMGLLGVGP